jgi:hypothetical protein
VKVTCAYSVRWFALLSFLASSAARGEPVSNSNDASAQARERFQRGLELFDERDLDGAMVEFRRAYELAKSYRILFNLGQVAAEKHDYAAALEFFGHYLRDGAGHIPDERLRTVEAELTKFRQRVGQMEITVAATDAEVLVDDEAVGRAPLSAPLTVNVGRRRVTIRTKEGVSDPQFVDVPSGERVRVEFKQAPSTRAKRVSTASNVAPTRDRVDLTASPANRMRGSDGMGTGTWLAWTVTGLCAVGAVTSGLLAYRWEQDLRNQRNSYPVTQEALANQQDKVRKAGWVTDGLMAGTVVFATISLTLTFRGSHDKSVLLSPRGLTLRQTF